MGSSAGLQLEAYRPCHSKEFDLIFATGIGNKIRVVTQKPVFSDIMTYKEWNLSDLNPATVENIRECKATLCKSKYNNYVYFLDLVSTQYSRLHQVPLFGSLGSAPTVLNYPYNIYEFATTLNDVPDPSNRVVIEKFEPGNEPTDIIVIYKSATNGRVICSYDLSTSPSTKIRVPRVPCVKIDPDEGSVVEPKWIQDTTRIHLWSSSYGKVLSYDYMTGVVT